MHFNTEDADNHQKIIIFAVKYYLIKSGNNYKSKKAIMEKISVKEALTEVYEQINWAYLSRNYFGKTRSWIYHKFSGRNNGKADDFSEEDRQTLKNALSDIAGKLTAIAEKL